MVYRQQVFDEERALYGIEDAIIEGCTFAGPADGESALKECRNITVRDSRFELRYPFWHVDGARISGIVMTESCRAALWYDKGVSMQDCRMDGIKALRECQGITLQSCAIRSPEFSWKCSGLDIRDCGLESEYPFFECRDMEIDHLAMKGKYSFQYVENTTIRNSELKTKDAFWHSKDVTVIDSVVEGEYLGWYSENLKLVRCRIIGTQPLCYCKGLVLLDCTMEHTDLAFERSEVEAAIQGSIDSVKNPIKGYISADGIGEVIWDGSLGKQTECQITVREQKG